MCRVISTLTISFILSSFLASCQDTKPVSTPGVDSIIGLSIGNIAPNIAYPDPEGKIISLNSLRGKMVLIDFWASWCPPCRRDNPSVVAAYHKFNDKKFRNGNGFTVYSVSCDNFREAWVDAIKKDQLVWENHVSDLKGWEAEATYTYKISAIPSNVLIDGTGKIVAKNISAEMLQSELASFLSE
jgi:thiol-disulfide isomerase/thioredoxin